jgi:diguanylate cyclase (GGDEF)-like protein
LSTSVHVEKPQSSYRLGVGRQLWIGAVVAVLLSTVLAGIILFHVSQLLSQARSAVVGLEQLRQVLETASRISAERAPSYVLMAGEPGQTATARTKLDAARAETDRSLNQAATIVEGVPFKDIMRNLVQARALVELAAAETPARYESVQRASEALFATYDAYQAVIMRKAALLINSDPELAGPVQHALILGALHDDAGRLGSSVIAPLIAGIPMPESDIAAGQRLNGRIKLQRQLLSLSPDPNNLGHLPASLRTAAETSLVKNGEPLVARFVAEGTHGSSYSMTAAAFTDRYAEALKPLGVWRRAYIDSLLADYQQKERQAWGIAWVVGTIMLCVISLIAGGVLLVHQRVLRPLLVASEAVVRLAHREPVHFPLVHNGSPELKPLFEAVELLDIKLREWDADTQRLRHQAETDELTSLLNRRAFQMLGETWLEGEWPDRNTFLILLDIDHFKSINDRYGHAMGDQVLVMVAAALQAHIRSDDLAGRIGGEEFAVLVRAQDQETALALAQRLRKGIEDILILGADGEKISVTASFGVAANRHFTWRQLMAKADVALYAAKQAGRNCVRVAEHGNAAMSA